MRYMPSEQTQLCPYDRGTLGKTHLVHARLINSQNIIHDGRHMLQRWRQGACSFKSGFHRVGQHRRRQLGARVRRLQRSQRTVSRRRGVGCGLRQPPVGPCPGARQDIRWTGARAKHGTRGSVVVVLTLRVAACGGTHGPASVSGRHGRGCAAAHGAKAPAWRPCDGQATWKRRQAVATLAGTAVVAAIHAAGGAAVHVLNRRHVTGADHKRVQRVWCGVVPTCQQQPRLQPLNHAEHVAAFRVRGFVTVAGSRQTPTTHGTTGGGLAMHKAGRSGPEPEPHATARGRRTRAVHGGWRAKACG